MLYFAAHITIASAGIKLRVHVAWVTSELLCHARAAGMLASGVLFTGSLGVWIYQTPIVDL